MARSHQRLLPFAGNEALAERLEELAEHLTSHAANPFRVRAYRQAARHIRQLDASIAEIAEKEGVEGLLKLPTIGKSLAQAIMQFVETGTLPLLERFRGEHSPERILQTVPDIGPKLARRIHEELGIETLAELQRSAWDGRLGRLEGMGKKRLQAVRESLAGRFRRHAEPSGRRPPSVEPASVPGVAELLDLDAEYRRLAEQGQLPRIAPTRFNPQKEAWLPVLHTTRQQRHYTVLFSNTARAHELGTTRDWVVIYRDDDEDHGQWTVITSGFGSLRGKRIIRGRESECELYYRQRTPRLEG